MNAKIVILIAALACQASANVRRLPTFGFSSNLGSGAEGRPSGGLISSFIPSIGGFGAQVPTQAGQIQNAFEQGQEALLGVGQGFFGGFQDGFGQGMEFAQNLVEQGLGQGMGIAHNLAGQVSNGVQQGVQHGQQMMQQGMGLGQQMMQQGMELGQHMMQQGMAFGQQIQNSLAAGAEKAFDAAAQVANKVQGGAQQFAKFTQDMANAALTGMKNVIAQGKNVMTGLNSIKENFMNQATEGAEQVVAIFNHAMPQGTTASNLEDMITQLQILAQSGSRPAQQAIAQINAFTASMGGNNAQQVQQAMNNLYAGVQGLAHQGRPLAAQFAGQIQNAATGFQQVFQEVAQQAAQQALAGAQQALAGAHQAAAGAQQAAQQAVNGAQQAVAGAQQAVEQAVEQAAQQVVNGAQQAVAGAQQAVEQAVLAATVAQEAAQEAALEAQQVQAQVLPVAPQTLVAEPAIAVETIQPAVVEP